MSVADDKSTLTLPCEDVKVFRSTSIFTEFRARLCPSAPYLSKSLFFPDQMINFFHVFRHGSNLLAKYGWCSMRCSRDEKWPVLEDWFNRFRSRHESDVDQTLFDDDFIGGGAMRPDEGGRC